MGADLYIRVPAEEDPSKIYRQEFDNAVAERNRLMEIHGKETIPNGDLFDPTFVNPDVQAAHERVDEAYGKMYGEENPFYFRDSYNSSSVLWTMGLSWWQDIETKELTEEDYENGEPVNMTPELCEKAAQLIESHEIEIESIDWSNFDLGDDPEKEKTDWFLHWVGKRQRLIDFFRRGAERGGVYASL